MTPGASASDDFAVSANGGEGSVELATTDTSIIWANLEGAGQGTLMSDTLENVSGNVTYELSGNTVIFTYTDTETLPSEYTVQVKDNSAPGKPSANGSTTTYNFGDGSIVSELYTGDYSISDGDSVSSTDGLVTLTGNNRIRYNGTSHGIMIGDGDQVSVKVAGNAEVVFELCSYTAAGSTLNVEVEGGGTVTPESADAQAAAEGDTVSFSYTGEEATLTFTYNGNGSGYLHSMDVANELEAADITEQEEMPSVSGAGLTETAAGQRLTLSQDGGSIQTGDALSGDVGYYGFDLTPDMNRIEADITVDECGSSSANGVFFGAFNSDAVAMLGLRNTTNIRGIHLNGDAEVSATGPNETIEEGQTIHFSAEKTADGLSITASLEDGTAYTVEYGENDIIFDGGVEDTELSFGFLLADATVTVTNMKYYNADGDLLYDQNDCYAPIGTAPVVNSVQADAADTRDAITITWNSSVLADGDGRYVVQVRKDGGEWEDLAETTEMSYTYPANESGTYEFRVGGKLGSEGEVTYCEETATVADYLPALPTPVVTLNAGTDAIDISWTESEGATAYEVYRYSSDEGAENPKLVFMTYSASTTSWQDAEVEQEVPYYYFVVAYQYEERPIVGNVEVNSSNPSEPVWAMASAGHTGDYVYEGIAAAITLTDCPNETVSQSTITLGGTVDRAGDLRVNVNGTESGQQDMTSDGTFRFDLNLAAGRNEVELIFTDSDGNVTRQSYNFVYLSSYDMVVDASYTGEDGAEVDGIPTFSTIQAAVDSVSADNAERKTIYIKSGDYEERLVVDSPYISLLGEDRDGVRIHCYPADLYPDDPTYEAGGDMSKRCATYVTADADGFSAENLTFANDYVYSTPDGKSNKSADALRCDADGATFVNVTISGVQDTLYMNEGNQYYDRCRIEGLIDFIYSGDAARAVFNDCEIVFVYEETHPDGGYVCAPRTAADAQYGLIFNNCVITSEEGCGDGTFHLARPWGPDAFIYWINCYMGSAINADEPYADMSGNAYTEARFYECGSYGPGYAVNADRRQISPAAAEALLENLGWNPEEALQSVNDSYVDPSVIDPGDPDNPGTEDPDNPGTEDPDNPGTEDPDNPGTEDPDKPGTEDPDNPGTEEPDKPGNENTPDNNNGNGSENGDQPKNDGTDNPSKDNENKADKQNTAEASRSAVATGDDTNLFIWPSLVILSGAAASITLVTRRKRS